MQNNKKQENLKKHFHMIYHENVDILFRHAFYKVSDRERAKDMVQDTFVKYWEYIHTSGEDFIQNTKALLFKIINNAITDYYRKKKTVSLDSLTEEGFDPSDLSIHQDILKSIDSQKAFSLVYKLDEHIRDIILMRYVDELSVKEISEVLGERENTVSVKIHRAIKELQKMFETQKIDEK
jgi:RNA polymerase sigma-70 factor, ECF subfamily